MLLLNIHVLLGMNFCVVYGEGKNADYLIMLCKLRIYVDNLVHESQEFISCLGTSGSGYKF